MNTSRRTRLALTAAVTAALGAALVPPASAEPEPAAASVTAAAPAPRANPGWALDRIDQRDRPLDGVYHPRSDGAGVTVYLIDTGLDAANPEFGGRASIGKDLLGGTGADCPDEMAVGHGTFVAGIVGGATTGVANGVNLVAVKALPCTEGVMPIPQKRQLRLIAKAARWVRHHAVRPAVVNMSLAVDHPVRPIDRAVRRLVRSGVPVVAAAGNDALNACLWSPAHLRSVITVAASDARDRSWRDSSFGGTNTGPCVDLYAPGKNITSVAAGDTTFRYAGIGATSWATPFVTGAVAQRLQRRPASTPEQIARWLRRTSTKGALHDVPRHTPNRLLYIGR